MAKSFEHLIVIGRPACGKSEFIDFLKNKVTDLERLERYHIAPFEEVDDFPWLWEKCLEDDIWEGLGYPRLVSKRTTPDYAITNPALREGFLLEKFNYEITNRYLSRPEFYKDHTLLIEFARGTDNGYRNAFNRLSKAVLERAAVLYIKVSFEESRRRNDARYQEKLRHSILAHKVPDEDILTYYVVDDWTGITAGEKDGYLESHGLKIPFVTMDNEPESTDPAVLDKRYGSALKRLMDLLGQKKLAKLS